MQDPDRFVHENSFIRIFVQAQRDSSRALVSTMTLKVSSIPTHGGHMCLNPNGGFDDDSFCCDHSDEKCYCQQVDECLRFHKLFSRGKEKSVADQIDRLRIPSHLGYGANYTLYPNQARGHLRAFDRHGCCRRHMACRTRTHLT